jgi:hypothetical protein
MLLVNGTIYIAWGSACDVGPYYGWVLGYDARTLRQTAVFNASPDAGESGIWQGDAGIAADPQGNVYAVTGNGKFTAASGGRDYGDSVLKLGFQKSGFSVLDYFTPFDESRLNRADDDLGSSGPVLLPDQPGPHPHLIAVAGKEGLIYLVDRDRMGRYQSGSNSHAVQTLKAAGTGAFGAPAFWNGHLYYFGSNDVLKDFTLENGRLSPQPVHQGGTRFKDPGAIPSISANGSKDGIVWLILTRGWRDRPHEHEAILEAYDAADIGGLLYTSAKLTRDGAGESLRFTIPTIAAGRVYVPVRSAVAVYGLRTAKDTAKRSTARK